MSSVVVADAVSSPQPVRVVDALSEFFDSIHNRTTASQYKVYLGFFLSRFHFEGNLHKQAEAFATKARADPS